jgi:ubiquinol-cytochrome c reductase core subunit 2
VLGSALSDGTLPLYEYAESVVPALESDYSQAVGNPAIWGMDVVHALAFRKGLGNSLFATPHGEVPYELAKSFATSAFATPSNIAIVASNVGAASAFKGLVGQYFQTGASGSSASAPAASSAGKYFGGETRIPHHSQDLLVVGFQGGPASDAKFTVLKHLLGGEPSVKWSSGASGLASAAPGAVAFNYGYSDAGLVGFTAAGANAGEIATKAVAELKKVAKGGLKAEDVKRAIAKAKFEAATLAESRSNLEQIASQVGPCPFYSLWLTRKHRTAPFFRLGAVPQRRPGRFRQGHGRRPRQGCRERPQVARLRCRPRQHTRAAVRRGAGPRKQVAGRCPHSRARCKGMASEDVDIA